MGQSGRSAHVVVLMRIMLGRTTAEDKGHMPDCRRADWDKMRVKLKDA